jgi:hypothetical protein
MRWSFFSAQLADPRERPTWPTCTLYTIWPPVANTRRRRPVIIVKSAKMVAGLTPSPWCYTECAYVVFVPRKTKNKGFF